MTDIVERLREGGETCGIQRCITREARSGCTCAEAADEIERLREALRKVRRAIVEADPEIVTCTLWLKDTMTETAVDCIDAALGEGKE